MATVIPHRDVDTQAELDAALQDPTVIPVCRAGAFLVHGPARVMPYELVHEVTLDGERVGTNRAMAA